MSELPERMRAAYITELGPAEAIRVGELPVPVPGPTGVLVRVEVVVVDPVDTMVRSGAYRTATPFPFVVGRDLVGTVAEVGAGVAGFAAGDRVWCNSLGHGGRQGSFAEYAVVPGERLITCRRGSTRWARWPWLIRPPPRTWRCFAMGACGPPRPSMWGAPPAMSAPP
jgi:NADPH:quinone reductase-like Zn-dependent oxidoreductase